MDNVHYNVTKSSNGTESSEAKCSSNTFLSLNDTVKSKKKAPKKVVTGSPVSKTSSDESHSPNNPVVPSESNDGKSEDGFAMHTSETKFPNKLFKILERDQFSHIITWMPHGKSWKILNARAFEEVVMPRYFNQTKIASFIRQANGWNFKKSTSGPDKDSYFNLNFLRGKPELISHMKRQPNKKKQIYDKHAVDFVNSQSDRNAFGSESDLAGASVLHKIGASVLNNNIHPGRSLLGAVGSHAFSNERSHGLLPTGGNTNIHMQTLLQELYNPDQCRGSSNNPNQNTMIPSLNQLQGAIMQFNGAPRHDGRGQGQQMALSSSVHQLLKPNGNLSTFGGNFVDRSKSLPIPQVQSQLSQPRSFSAVANSSQGEQHLPVLHRTQNNCYGFNNNSIAIQNRGSNMNNNIYQQHQYQFSNNISQGNQFHPYQGSQGYSFGSQGNVVTNQTLSMPQQINNNDNNSMYPGRNNSILD